MVNVTDSKNLSLVYGGAGGDMINEFTITNSSIGITGSGGEGEIHLLGGSSLLAGLCGDHDSISTDDRSANTVAITTGNGYHVLSLGDEAGGKINLSPNYSGNMTMLVDSNDGTRTDPLFNGAGTITSLGSTILINLGVFATYFNFNYSSDSNRAQFQSIDGLCNEFDYYLKDNSPLWDAKTGVLSFANLSHILIDLDDSNGGVVGDIALSSVLKYYEEILAFSTASIAPKDSDNLVNFQDIVDQAYVYANGLPVTQTGVLSQSNGVIRDLGGAFAISGNGNAIYLVGGSGANVTVSGDMNEVHGNYGNTTTISHLNSMHTTFVYGGGAIIDATDAGQNGNAVINIENGDATVYAKGLSDVVNVKTSASATIMGDKITSNLQKGAVAHIFGYQNNLTADQNVSCDLTGHSCSINGDVNDIFYIYGAYNTIIFTNGLQYVTNETHNSVMVAMTASGQLLTQDITSFTAAGSVSTVVADQLAKDSANWLAANRS